MDDALITARLTNQVDRNTAAQRIIGFAQQFGEAHLNLACHAAFPLALTLFDGTARPLFWLLLPIPIVSQLLLTIGLVYIIAAAGVFFRDMRNIIQLFLMIGLFVHPILYAPGMVPTWTMMVFQALPFSHVIWMYRDVVMGGIEHPASWLIAPALGIACVMIGYRTFQFGRHMFGDAL